MSQGLDLTRRVRSTERMHSKSARVVCPVFDLIEAEQHTKRMVRQRSVGETGGETG